MPSPPSPWRDAPLFHLFWHNGELNPARAEVMRTRIAEDAARPWSPPRPVHAAAGIALPDPVLPGDALAQRHSGRRFGDARWGAQELGHVLAPLRARPGDSDTRRLPSGGAKYPIQAYAALYGADEAIAIGLATRKVARGTTRREAEALAREIAGFPPIAMTSDRQSAYESFDRDQASAVRREMELSLAARRQESQRGAARFVKGEGRHGKFERQ